ncbi:hypothetical protein AB0I75_31865 [Streptomyces sp. NPDC050273]|uniref:hypothetical protein n=1 Tax=Streptomyces sp. NPDC050273 TaxID=3154933 RepID=UPI0034285BAE
MAPRRLRRADRESLLSGMPGVCSDAAACALYTESPQRAFDLLEQGRSVLAAQILNARADLTEVQSRSPGLADRFRSLQQAFDRTAGPGTFAADSPDDQLVALDAQLDAIIETIRMLDGLESFPYLCETDAREVAGESTVVTINISQYRSDAFVHMPDVLEVIPLPNADSRVIEQQYTIFEAALEDASKKPSHLVSLR